MRIKKKSSLLFAFAMIILTILYTYLVYFTNPVIELITVFVAYFVLFVVGLQLFNKFTETGDAAMFIVSQALIVIGIFIILFLSYVIQAIKITQYFDYRDTFTMASLSLAITALFMPKSKKDLKKLDKKFKMIIFLTLISTIIFFFIGISGMSIPHMFGKDIPDIQYLIIETLFFLASTNLFFSAVILFGSIYEDLGIKFKKFKK